MTITAKCQATGAQIPLDKGFLVGNSHTGEWSFQSSQAPEKMADYAIPLGDVAASPQGLVDWLAHLREKSWFDPAKFFDFMVSFRRENNLFGHL